MMPLTTSTTDTDDQMQKRVVLQSVRDGMVRCLYDTWDKQCTCSLSVKSAYNDRCMFYFESLRHCWLPEYRNQGDTK